MEFEVGDRVMLKVSPWKGVVLFGKRGKLNPRYVRPFKVLAKVGKVAYKLELPQELSRVYHTFHGSNLKKCYADEPLVMPLEGIHVDDKLQFAGTQGEVLSSPGNVKICSNRNTHKFSQTGLRHPLQGSGYQQKDRKPSQNDKVRVNTEESAVKPEPELKNTIGCNLNPSDGPGKPNSIIMKTVKTKWALNQLQQPICVHLTKTVKTLKAQS
ncbi:hypothetical protein Tco_0127946 [Tanacetum coccineum]